jgi:hypothetical protein
MFMMESDLSDDQASVDFNLDLFTLKCCFRSLYRDIKHGKRDVLRQETDEMNQVLKLLLIFYKTTGLDNAGGIIDSLSERVRSAIMTNLLMHTDVVTANLLIMPQKASCV